MLRNSVDALKPIHHFVIILSHPVEIVFSPVDRLLSSSFRTTKSDTFLHSELHQLFKKKQKNRKWRNSILQTEKKDSVTSFNSSSVLNDDATALMIPDIELNVDGNL